MEKVRVIRKRDGQSMDYEVGDIFTVDSTWYGGVNVTSALGIPLSLDREEYEIYEETEKREIDPYSYGLGVMDCFCEMVAAGVKKLALSHPFDTREERDGCLEAVKELCRQYRVRFYLEDELIETELFPAEPGKKKYLFLFYEKEEVLEAYLELKERRRMLEEQGSYGASARFEIAREFGGLLSYPEETIGRMIRKYE